MGGCRLGIQVLSIFFQKCLQELGGGQANRLLVLIDGVFTTEKAFAAACIKHNGLIYECIKFSRSVDILRMIRTASKKGMSFMFNPKTPSWFKNVVQSFTSTFSFN